MGKVKKASIVILRHQTIHEHDDEQRQVMSQALITETYALRAWILSLKAYHSSRLRYRDCRPVPALKIASHVVPSIWTSYYILLSASHD
jgi:hypothetical protein